MTGCSGLASPPSAFQEDFENGSAGWEGGETMAQDAAVAHGGARSLRLAVADPMHDAVYVTRKVPVVGGAYYAASCFVKIDNVVEAPGVKPSAGAGFIVEWADKDGAWMKDGQYACGLRGTAVEVGILNTETQRHREAETKPLPFSAPLRLCGEKNFAAAARGPDGSLAVMFANPGEEEVPLALEIADSSKRTTASRCRIVDETRTWEEAPLPAALPPHSILLVEVAESIPPTP